MSKRVAVPGGYRFLEQQGVYGEWIFLPIAIAVEEMQLIRKLHELPPLSREELTDLFQRASRNGAFLFVICKALHGDEVMWYGRDMGFMKYHLDVSNLYIPVGLKSEAKYILVHECCKAPFVEPRLPGRFEV